MHAMLGMHECIASGACLVRVVVDGLVLGREGLEVEGAVLEHRLVGAAVGRHTRHRIRMGRSALRRLQTSRRGRTARGRGICTIITDGVAWGYLAKARLHRGHDVLGVCQKAVLRLSVSPSILRPEVEGGVHARRRLAQQSDEAHALRPVHGAHDPRHRQLPMAAAADALLPLALGLARAREADVARWRRAARRQVLLPRAVQQRVRGGPCEGEGAPRSLAKHAGVAPLVLQFGRARQQQRVAASASSTRTPTVVAPAPEHPLPRVRLAKIVGIRAITQLCWYKHVSMCL
eukprot:3818212-Pleurochrysis_carterae.AAC.1